MYARKILITCQIVYALDECDNSFEHTEQDGIEALKIETTTHLQVQTTTTTIYFIQVLHHHVQKSLGLHHNRFNLYFSHSLYHINNEKPALTICLCICAVVSDKTTIEKGRVWLNALNIQTHTLNPRY